jgi:hypothetical protein
MEKTEFEILIGYASEGLANAYDYLSHALNTKAEGLREEEIAKYNRLKNEISKILEEF